MALQKRTCCMRIRKELAWQRLWLDENNPRKFATTAWMRTQYPFLAYRIICFIYSASVLSWNCYQASKLSSEHLVAEWFLSYPTWSFMMFTLYCTLSLLLTGFNFDNDCLCNDDLSWYHKVCWVFHIISFNTTLSCLLGTLAYLIARSADSTDAMTYIEVFKSDDINFYVISAMVMMVDVFIHDISVRLLHFVYSDGYFILYCLIHVYRWAAGYIPTYMIFSFSVVPASMPTLFILFVMFIYIPIVHQVAFGIDSLRKKLLIIMWSRNKHERLQTNHSTYRNTAVASRSFPTTTSPPEVSSSGVNVDVQGQSTVELRRFYDGYEDILQMSAHDPKRAEQYAMTIMSRR